MMWEPRTGRGRLVVARAIESYVDLTRRRDVTA